MKKYANDTKIAAVTKIKIDHSVLQNHFVILNGRVIKWKIKFIVSNLHNAHGKTSPNYTYKWWTLNDLLSLKEEICKLQVSEISISMFSEKENGMLRLVGR